MDVLVYVDVGDMAENVATLNFAFSNQASQGTRQWDMKVTQIPCGSNAAWVFHFSTDLCFFVAEFDAQYA